MTTQVQKPPARKRGLVAKIFIGFLLFCAGMLVIGVVRGVIFISQKVTLLMITIGSYIGYALVAVPCVTVLGDLGSPLIGVIRRRQAMRRQAAACLLPRHEAMRNRRYKSRLEQMLGEALDVCCERICGFGCAALSSPDFATLKARHLPSILAQPPVVAFVEQHLVATLLERVLEGEEAVLHALERLWRGRSRKRFGWISMRLLSLITLGRLGWRGTQAQQTFEEAVSNFASLRNLILESPAAWSGLEDLAGPIPALPSAPADERKAPSREELAPPPPEPPVPPPEGQTPVEDAPAAEVPPVPPSWTHPESAPTRQGAEDLEAIGRQLADPDSELYDHPDRGLAQAAELLALIAAEPSCPAGVEAVHQRVRVMQARLAGFEALWRRETDDRRGGFCPLMLQALAELPEVPDERYVATLRRRLCFAFLHCDDPSLLEAPASFASPHEDPSEPVAGRGATTETGPHESEGASRRGAREAGPFPRPPHRDVASEYGL